MKKISKFLSENPRYRRLQKPLEAAEICEIARSQSQGLYEIISFKNGLLTVNPRSPAQAATLQVESENIIDKINQKIGRKAVTKIRFKIIQ